MNWSFLHQEFFDEWPIKLGEQEPYKGPKTPDGRVSPTLGLLLSHYSYSPIGEDKYIKKIY